MQVGQVQGRSALQVSVERERAQDPVKALKEFESAVKEIAVADPSQAVTPVAKLEETLNTLAGDFLGAQKKLSIQIDEETGKFVYQAIDRATGEVLFEYPSEEFLQRLAHFLEANPVAEPAVSASGMAIDEKA